MDPNTARALDAWLVVSARTGDREALEALVERWHGRLLRHAVRVTEEPDLARDALQDAWIDILRGLGRLEDAEAFPAWALRIVTRRCQRVLGRRRRRLDVHAAVAREPVSMPRQPSEEVSDAEAVAIALRALPAAQKATVALFYLESLTVAEVAVALDVPVGTVKTRLMHARSRLRAALGGTSDDEAR